MIQHAAKRITVCLALLLLLVWPSAAPVFADNGDGTGPSEGTPGAKPLNFVSATLVNGGTSIIDAADVPLRPKIRIAFDKNVVNSAVWGINRECFLLLDSGKNPVPAEVTKVDDSIDFSQRQIVFVEPLEDLKPGVGYSLKVKPELLAKNGISTLGGTTSGRGITLLFTTVKAQAAPAQETAATPAAAASAKPAAKPSAGTAVAAAAPSAKPAVKPSAAASAAASHAAASAAGEAPQTTPSAAAPSAQPESTPAASPSAAEASPSAVASADGTTPPSAAPAGAAPAPAASAEPAGGSPNPGGADSGTAITGEQAAGGDAAAGGSAAEDTPALSETGGAVDWHWRLMMAAAAVLLAGWFIWERVSYRRKQARGKRPKE
ncbi:hypothetical protein KIH86_12250 [Paenibacillus sp. HN-1]|uniref:Ig-like domain-containing protein n=1 Tax=Paenibacillus TaxID=44249 RepID=UPI001CA95B29|nr:MULTISPECIES: Ig-like domain-containing protein [Paenibacillus]MBY9081475.1 hypothetical protein [Paenibacillus sp. CGMCC 1.18879]MBY9084995.1 hypothetical protein [Paenibacillus sinensis]